MLLIRLPGLRQGDFDRSLNVFGQERIGAEYDFGETRQLLRGMECMSESSTIDQKLRRFTELLEVGQIITSEMNFDTLFPLVMEHTSSIMESEACSVFLFDRKADDLYCLVSSDLKECKIRVPIASGISGWVFQHRAPVVVNDTLNDPRFNATVDAKIGFHTRNILCVPLINRQKECIGTLQALNKRAGSFDDEDIEVLTSLSNYVTVALENSRLYEELKAMSKAKDRAISHLSHELKTPLALISAAVGETLRRNSQRATSWEPRGISAWLKGTSTDSFVSRKRSTTSWARTAVEYQTQISRLIEDAFHLIEYQRDEVHDDALERVADFIASIYRVDAESVETICYTGVAP